MKKILMPVDGTTTCDKTLQMTKEIAEKFNSDVIVLFVKPVVQPLSHPGRMAQETFTDITNQGEWDEIVNLAKAQFEDVDVNVQTMIVEGDPASEIIDVATTTECDLIVMCTHGMSAMKRFMLGSITNKVVHHATIPVLIVR